MMFSRTWQAKPISKLIIHRYRVMIASRTWKLKPPPELIIHRYVVLACRGDRKSRCGGKGVMARAGENDGRVGAIKHRKSQPTLKGNQVC